MSMMIGKEGLKLILHNEVENTLKIGERRAGEAFPPFLLKDEDMPSRVLAK